MPTLSALWSMRSPQIIHYPVEPSTESADSVSTLEYEVSTGHMLPSVDGKHLVFGCQLFGARGPSLMTLGA